MSYIIRHPRTMQERRAAHAVLTENEESGINLSRPRRGVSRNSLPSEYDDLPNPRVRSWKRHRRSQWKKKEGGENE